MRYALRLNRYAYAIASDKLKCNQPITPNSLQTLANQKARNRIYK